MAEMLFGKADRDSRICVCYCEGDERADSPSKEKGKQQFLLEHRLNELLILFFSVQNDVRCFWTSTGVPRRKDYSDGNVYIYIYI